MKITACILVVSTIAAAACAAEPTFPPHPRVATSRAELANLKQSPDYEATKADTLKSADMLLKKTVEIPNGWGNWFFYYACPDDGNTLQPANLNEHRCPQCKKLYTDERTVAAYRTVLHDNANTAVLQLAWAYTYSEDDRYAREVQRVLLKYADDYATYPARRDRWGNNGILAMRGGRRYSQSLDEAIGILKLAKAYDLIHNAPIWKPEQRKHLENDFFRPTADTLLYYNFDINNHQTWFNAGLLAIAGVLGDKELVNKVLTMKGGFHDQLARSAGRDGLWYEGAMAYHNYALQAMIEIVDLGRRLGLPLHREPRFQALIRAPLKYAYPNGQFPAINDSDYSHISSFNGSFRWAWQTYREPIWAQALAHGNRETLHKLLGTAAEPQAFIEQRSMDLPDAGLAVLRRGSGKDAICVMMDYGPHGGGHGHYDKLNLVLFAQGREWLLDPGRLTYSHKEYKTWVKHTAAHNTVTLGGKSQSETTGKLITLQIDKDSVQASAESTEAYPGATLRRTLFLTDHFLLDLFDVHCSEVNQIDCLAHVLSQKVQAVDELGPGTEAVLGTTDGYPHLKNGKGWKIPAGTTRWDFVSDGKALRAWCVAVGPEQHLTCMGIGYWISQQVPCLVRRVQGKAARFVTVYDLTGDGAGVQAVRREGNRIIVESARRTWKLVDSQKGVAAE